MVGRGNKQVSIAPPAVLQQWQQGRIGGDVAPRPAALVEETGNRISLGRTGGGIDVIAVRDCAECSPKNDVLGIASVRNQWIAVDHDWWVSVSP